MIFYWISERLMGILRSSWTLIVSDVHITEDQQRLVGVLKTRPPPSKDKQQFNLAKMSQPNRLNGYDGMVTNL